MLNDFQQRIYDAIFASGLLDHEQGTLRDGAIVFPTFDGWVEVEIPKSPHHYAYTRSTASNGTLTEYDLRRASAIANTLAQARDGKPILQQEVTLW